jgi:hypothetical protein
MANNVIDKVSIDVGSSILWADSVEVDTEDGTDFVDAMTDNNEPLGIKRGTEKFTITVEVSMTTDQDDEIDAAWEDKRNIPVTIYFDGGNTWSFSKGAISKAGISAKSGEAVQRRIEVKSWSRARS